MAEEKIRKVAKALLATPRSLKLAAVLPLRRDGLANLKQALGFRGSLEQGCLQYFVARDYRYFVAGDADAATGHNFGIGIGRKSGVHCVDRSCWLVPLTPTPLFFTVLSRSTAARQKRPASAPPQWRRHRDLIVRNMMSAHHHHTLFTSITTGENTVNVL